MQQQRQQYVRSGGRALLFVFVSIFLRQKYCHAFSIRSSFLCRYKDSVDSSFLRSSTIAQLTDKTETIRTSCFDLNFDDPLLSNALLQMTSSSLSHTGDDYDDHDWSINNVAVASRGLSLWKRFLIKGQIPEVTNFPNDEVWPSEPFFSLLIKSVAEMELPRFVLRHPETVSSVLLSVLRWTNELSSRQQQKQQEFIDGDDEYNNFEIEKMYIKDSPYLTDEELVLLAEEMINGFNAEWGGIIQGMQALDSLFGQDHGLLELSDNSGNGFGLQDGIWQHSGWEALPELQQLIVTIPELKLFLKGLGRRPTAISSDGTLHKFIPRKAHPDGGMGAEWDSNQRDTMNNIALSNKLSDMLPSEAALLRGKTSVLRRRFLSKIVESKLLSYQTSGFTDVPSFPVTRNRHLSRLPSAPGGPIIICLDTSWSMSGMREELSKATVLACVSLAHKQGRQCQVVAFSTERGVMECGTITKDANGIRRLLTFLSNSFAGGGTDVTGALKFAMKTLDSDTMSAADILLLTDGEIPDPPISSQEIVDDIDRLKRRTGMEIHGLLVGKSESIPLSKLCTETHNFLFDYDNLSTIAESKLSSFRSTTTSTTLSVQKNPESRRGSNKNRKAWGWGRQSLALSHGRGVSALYAKYSMYDDGDYQNKKGKKRRKKKKWADDDDEDYNYGTYNTDNDDESSWGADKTKRSKTNDKISSEDTTQKSLSQSNLPGEDYISMVEEAVEHLRLSAATQMESIEWKPEFLDEEKNSERSCWKYRDELQKAIGRISEGLVERDAEARLVVLATISQEHILLLGPPGTAKSILGRRLSRICGGQFFQRLLTRFTTPEEIFGPLSLRALENDEYKRCTNGFLPTASVAFLDEIFKANSAILNTLLTILNERQFDNGGGIREECLIRCVVGASNELPESDELDALYDRFLLRKEVLPVSDEGVMQMLGMSAPGVSHCDDGDEITTGGAIDDVCDSIFAEEIDEMVRMLSSASKRVEMGSDICVILKDLRTFMKDELDVDISDRRLVKAAQLLKVSAASHGRNRVDALDCLLLQHMAWRLPEQRTAVREWLWDNLASGGARSESTTMTFRLLLNGLRREAIQLIRKTSGDVTGESGARPQDVVALNALRDETKNIINILEKQVQSVLRHQHLLEKATNHLWLDSDLARSLQQLWMPKADSALTQIRETLLDTNALYQALSSTEASPTNEFRLSVIESLWDEQESPEFFFTEDELDIGMKEAKSKYDADTFRAWKRARKKRK